MKRPPLIRALAACAVAMGPKAPPLAQSPSSDPRVSVTSLGPAPSARVRRALASEVAEIADLVARDCAKGANPAPSPTFAPAAAPSFSGLSEPHHPLVLVVDDDDAIQSLLGRLLRLKGFTPVSATNIAGAVGVADEQQFDAVILDLSLKGRESGLDFLAWLRQHPDYETVPILILTGQTVLGEDDEALIRRHRAYVFYKPQPITVLVEYLTRLT